jgi:hypothetical protein
MDAQTWHLDQSDGHLTIRTGVEGPAAKMGHRLTIAMNYWSADVEWDDSEPIRAWLTVEVDSLTVLFKRRATNRPSALVTHQHSGPTASKLVERRRRLIVVVRVRLLDRAYEKGVDEVTMGIPAALPLIRVERRGLGVERGDKFVVREGDVRNAGAPSCRASPRPTRPPRRCGNPRQEEGQPGVRVPPLMIDDDLFEERGVTGFGTPKFNLRTETSWRNSAPGHCPVRMT